MVVFVFVLGGFAGCFMGLCLALLVLDVWRK